MSLKLNILDRYLFREIAMTWLVVMAVLLMVMLSAEVAKLLSWVAEGRLSGEFLVPMLTNSLIRYAVVLMPLGLMLATMMSFGRLYRDNEMAALSSAGSGLIQYLRPLALILVPASLALLLANLFFVPHLISANERMLDEHKSDQDITALSAGRFNLTAGGQSVFFIETLEEEEGRAGGVFIMQENDDGETVTTAQYASNSSSDDANYLVLVDGVQHAIDSDDEVIWKTEFEEYAIRLDAREASSRIELKAQSTQALLDSADRASAIELHWRVTIPVAMVLLVLISFPMSRVEPRKSAYSRLALGMLFYLMYSNLLAMSKNWMLSDTIPLWLGSWWVHLLVLAGLIYWLNRQGYLSAGRGIA